MRIVLTAALLGMAVAGQAAAQDFTWHKPLAAGRRLEVKGVNGSVRAVAARGGEAVVNATKHARRSDPEDVKIEVVESEDGVTICAVYPTPRRAREENVCLPGDRWHSSTENNDWTVDVQGQVPQGVGCLGAKVDC